jgi:hypothetical protein
MLAGTKSIADHGREETDHSFEPRQYGSATKMIFLRPNHGQ